MYRVKKVCNSSTQNWQSKIYVHRVGHFIYSYSSQQVTTVRWFCFRQRIRTYTQWRKFIIHRCNNRQNVELVFKIYICMFTNLFSTEKNVRNQESLWLIDATIDRILNYRLEFVQYNLYSLKLFTLFSFRSLWFAEFVSERKLVIHRGNNWQHLEFTYIL